ncbi:MAG TPA: hypothetical protein VHC49_16080, partial [Mycobacteriales bacterium]|nr:hypothetical protein [Mycobacteriales bacterium]
ERRRRNTVDRPMGRESSTTTARTTSRTTATGVPATGAVIRSDGRLTRPGAPAGQPDAQPAVRPDAPEVARRARRREEEPVEQPAGPRLPDEEPAGHQPRHRHDEPVPRHQEAPQNQEERRPADDERPGRRQDRTVVREVVRTGGREPAPREEPQEPTVTSGPAPENRRQGQRADFIDPEP